LTVYFKDGSTIGEIAIEYPIGHKRRRNDGIPLLIEKYKKNLSRIYDSTQQEAILKLTLDYENFSKTPVDEVMNLLVKRSS
jgi:2-methylcitrate dehydratase